MGKCSRLVPQRYIRGEKHDNALGLGFVFMFVIVCLFVCLFFEFDFNFITGFGQEKQVIERSLGTEP